jgi:D-sedoheptulose 7-phosphate isomerase
MWCNYASKLTKAIDSVPVAEYEHVLTNLFHAIKGNCEVFVIGNGGSSSTASHFVNDLAKLLPDKTDKFVRAFCLSDNTPLVTAIANDVAYEEVFSAQVARFMGLGNILIAFSGSGNSPNIIQAIEDASAQGCMTIGFCGRDGGRLAQVAEVSLTVPNQSMQIIEDVHLAISHSLVLDLIEMFGV